MPVVDLQLLMQRLSYSQPVKFTVTAAASATLEEAMPIRREAERESLAVNMLDDGIVMEEFLARF